MEKAGEQCVRVLCPKKKLLSQSKNGSRDLQWLIGSPLFLPPITVVSSFRCVHFLDDGDPDLLKEAGPISLHLYLLQFVCCRWSLIEFVAESRLFCWVCLKNLVLVWYLIFVSLVREKRSNFSGESFVNELSLTSIACVLYLCVLSIRVADSEVNQALRVRRREK